MGEQKRPRLRVCALNAMANTIVPMGLSVCICLASFCFIFLVRILIESERKWKLERIRWKQCEENGNVGESREREGNIGNKWETNTIANRRRNAHQHVNNWLECVAAYEQKCVSAQCFVWCFRGIHRICPHTHCAYSSWMSCVRSPLNGDAAAAASHFCYFALSMLISRERFHIHILDVFVVVVVLCYLYAFLQLCFLFVGCPHTMNVLCMLWLFLFMRVHIFVILCDYIFHYIRERESIFPFHMLY